MRNLVWKVVLIVAILALCVWRIIPPEENIRLGQDLRGGVSLVYHLTIPEDTPNKAALVTQVIEVLQERVNPAGKLDIIMRPLGQDRIEISMPLPSKRVKELKRQYEIALQGLMSSAQILESELRAALTVGDALDRYGAQGERGAVIGNLQMAFDSWQSARDVLDAAEQRGAEDAELRPLQNIVVTADLEFDKLFGEARRLSLPKRRVTRALRLSQEEKQERDAQNNPVERDGKKVMEPSPRAIELDSIRGDYPWLVESLNQLVEYYDTYASERKGFDDPEDLMRLLRGAGVLQFHIAVQSDAGSDSGVNVDEMRRQLAEGGPRSADSTIAAWYELNDPKQWYNDGAGEAALRADPIAYFENRRQLVAGMYEDQIYLLLYTQPSKSMMHRPDTEWQIVQTSTVPDQLGRPAVAFELDTAGGILMRQLTQKHINQPMAIVLDDQVYSAPNINSAIGTSGVIEGQFSQEELQYLRLVLTAGALEASLSSEPVAISTIGPSIGADNLDAGLTAFKYAIIAVALFMLAYYFFAGLVADIALLTNGVIIFGFMSFIDGTFTLPGLAGIILTIGMAVDANVLIYERIREELFAGDVDLRIAIRQGYRKALSTILDANITNLIVCAVLYQTATTEIKGFALTLSIGIIATLITALFVTRVIYEIYTDVVKMTRLPMLPTVIPFIHRALEPNINWIGLRKVFWTISIVAVIGSIALVIGRGVDMFDTEFRGGVAATMVTQIVDDNDDGQPDELHEDQEPVRIMLPHIGADGVETRVRSLASLLDASGDAAKQKRFQDAMDARDPTGQIDEETVKRILAEITRASVLTEGYTEARENRLHGESFQVKVASPKGIDENVSIDDVIVAALIAEFDGELDVPDPLSFRGEDGGHADHTFGIDKPVLGDNFREPRHTDDVSRFLGGVVVVVKDIQPPVTPQDVVERISRLRQQPDFESLLDRQVEVFGLDPALDSSDGRFESVAIAVHDPNIDFQTDDFDTWDRELAQPEWALIKEALKQPSSLKQVSSFSSAVAETLAKHAAVAVVLTLLGILTYIWIRFGSLRYSLAAIVALVHDVSIALGLLALTAWMGGSALSSFFLVEEFRIDLGVVAALLTIIGYSLNDTIVILDRIRENRGKLPIPNAEIVNRSINQTMSRTILTSVTTLAAVGIMYGAGGSGIRPFTFCLLVGLVVGTYSSVAIAAPLVVKSEDHSDDEPATVVG